MILEDLARMAAQLLKDRPELARAEVFAVWRKGKGKTVFMPISALGPGMGELGRTTVDVVTCPERVITVGRIL